jgi:hypothetical protein
MSVEVQAQKQATRGIKLDAESLLLVADAKRQTGLPHSVILRRSVRHFIPLLLAGLVPLVEGIDKEEE